MFIKMVEEAKIFFRDRELTLTHSLLPQGQTLVFIGGDYVLRQKLRILASSAAGRAYALL